MNIDSASLVGIIGSAIVATGSITAALITRGNKDRSQSFAEKSTNSLIADIRATWFSDYQGEEDRIKIESINGRQITGTRKFKGKSGVEYSYDIVGFFDGMILSLAATCRDYGETRTLAIVMRRQGGSKFVGRRTYSSKGAVISNDIREWRRID